MPETTNPQPDRYRQRPIEVDAIQWTGHNADALREFAGIDFATIDPADRTDDLDCDAQLLVEASHWVGIQPTDWVLKFEGYFIAKSDVPFRAVWEPASPSAPANRGALSEAERKMLTYALDQAQEKIWSEDGFTDEDQAAVTSLRRLADEPAPGPSRVAGEAQQDACPGYETAPNRCTCDCEGCKHHCAAHQTGEAPQPCDGCGHPVHPSRQCPVVLYGETCTCDEPLVDEAQQPETEDGEAEKLAKAGRMAKAFSTPPVAPPEWDATKEWPMRHKRAGDRRVHAAAAFSVNGIRRIWTACGKPVGEGGYPLSHMPVDCRDCQRATAAEQPAVVSQPGKEA